MLCSLKHKPYEAANQHVVDRPDSLQLLAAFACEGLTNNRPSALPFDNYDRSLEDAVALAIRSDSRIVARWVRDAQKTRNAWIRMASETW
jgi:hypothetical protein